ncbi:MAG: tRNA (N6-threonylcarbamoyladenosine(37)-N6)-methyltransferase TrmO [Clostridia bacterium]|nr:tRNA (N6-threonylcarbamoyladenosine(37)-N6)-methyltransferase TrmO [Clostridia bacterium]
MKKIAHIRTDFPEKFGLPRQSGLVEGLVGRIVFEPEYRVPEALRGIEGFSHLWLIWEFSEALRPTWSPTVRPPRLGGNKRMGVFATRSPFRPNPVGLSCVKLEGWEMTDEGPVITVSGIDIMDGTPIYDIKPYLPHADCKPEATGGFSTDAMHHSLEVIIPEELEAKIEEKMRKPLTELLSQDPRPGYAEDGDRIYGFTYGMHEISFTVNDGTLTVCAVEGRKK